MPIQTPSTQNPKSRSRKSTESQQELLTSLIGKPHVRFRRLKCGERVIYGDYVENGDSSYRLWDGPTGFRADSFLNKVYRPEQKGRN